MSKIIGDEVSHAHVTHSCHPQLSPAIALQVEQRIQYNIANLAKSRKYIIAFENTMLLKYTRLLGQSGNWKPYGRDSAHGLQNQTGKLVE